MCEHCGCRGIETIAELMDEHYALLDRAHDIRLALGAGDRADAVAQLRVLARHLAIHVRREEEGVFAALRALDEFVDELDRLEGEHRAFDAALVGLDPDASGFDHQVGALLRDLDDHVERENLGIFPVSTVTLGEQGWGLVAEARRAHPTFLEAPTAHE